MAEEQHGLFDGAFDEPYDPSKAFDRSQEVDLGAIAVEWTKEQSLRERNAQREAEAMSLCEDIDALIVPHMKEEHCTAGVATPSGRVSKLTDQDWAVFNRLKAYTAELGANVDRGRWQISEQGCAAFLIHEAAEHGPDHARKCRNSISRVTRAMLDVAEHPIVRAAMAHICDDGPDEDKPTDKGK